MGRSDMKKWFKETANVFYSNTLSDGAGGFTKEWIRKYYQIPCRTFDRGSSGEYTIEEQGVNYPVERKILCDVDIDISKGDKIVVDDESFIVLRSTTPKSGREHHTACLLGRIEEDSNG